MTDKTLELIEWARDRAAMNAPALPKTAARMVQIADLLASCHSLAQAAGYSEIGEALKAIPVMRDVIHVMGGALDEADGVIAINCGLDTPNSWNRAFARCQKARARLAKRNPV